MNYYRKSLKSCTFNFILKILQIDLSATDRIDIRINKFFNFLFYLIDVIVIKNFIFFIYKIYVVPIFKHKTKND